ncbi:hypothetical protein C4D60_Mb09t25580 [Musa balbisiana]|uniref:HMA domain-containing protein n=1 Tax=Musa balbisiana TaxID=52838 RepID=A0A4V4H3I4_MUSBA|nr:hypothetical protein C4D60_Mb09t25580 [Musa balbisiana]
MKRTILKMKGVRAAEPDLKASQVTVKGVFDPRKLGEYVYKQTGKQAVVAKQEPAEKKTEDEKDRGRGWDVAKSEKKAGGAGGGNADGEKKEEKDGKDGSAPPPPAKVVELNHLNLAQKNNIV